MSRRFRTTGHWRSALLAALLFLGFGAYANTIEVDSAKAGFILNFIKYSEWPPTGSPNASLLVCSLGDQALSGKLELMQGRQVQGREIRVRTAVRPGEWRECAVLFIAADEAQRIDTVLRATGQYPVLTISDAPGFVQAGGIIGLNVRAGRIRFDINNGAARQGGLKLSSQLLRLADEVLP
jgi:hypothetical protein